VSAVPAGGTSRAQLALHVLRRALRSLWENAYLNSVSTGVIAAALLLLGMYLNVQFNLTQLVEGWDRDVHVSAYFRAEVAPARREALAERLRADPRVAGVQLVTEAEAGAWLAERVPDLAPVLTELGPEVLPASLEISLREPAALEAHLAELAPLLDPADFDEVDHGREWVARFDAFVSAVRSLGALFGLLIVVSALFLVTNTVYLVIYSRRDELEIQKLVGATTGFIVAPFLVEGLFQGLIGAALAVGGMLAASELVLSRLELALGLEATAGLAFLPLPWLLVLVLMGVTLGVGSALVAVARFLAAAP
jgi:cell division transport system permease protein